MSGIRINAAAEMLGVSPSTLRSWERRLGYPHPRRTPGNHRLYELDEVEALREALRETQNISSAVEVARQRGRGPASPARLLAAFDRFDEAAADRELEESLAVRSVERTVSEVLLPALEMAERRPNGEAELEHACRWATGWLHGARRLAAGATRPEGVLLLDSGSPLGVESVHVQALELFLRRAGLRVLLLSAGLAEGRFRSALRALQPTAVVICGSEARLDVLGGPLRRAAQPRTDPPASTATAPLAWSPAATACPRSARTRRRRRRRCSPSSPSSRSPPPVRRGAPPRVCAATLPGATSADCKFCANLHRLCSLAQVRGCEPAHLLRSWVPARSRARRRPGYQRGRYKFPPLCSGSTNRNRETMQSQHRDSSTSARPRSFLGVSAASLRKWSDQGLVPVYRTPAVSAATRPTTSRSSSPRCASRRATRRGAPLRPQRQLDHRLNDSHRHPTDDRPPDQDRDRRRVRSPWRRRRGRGRLSDRCRLGSRRCSAPCRALDRSAT